MKLKRIVIGTRSSELALWQAEFVKKKLHRIYPQLTIDMKLVSTKGDRIIDKPLDKIGDKGLFTKELENEILSGEIDFAVHSLKDLEVDLNSDLMLGAVTKRESVEDVLISKRPRLSIRKLPKKAVIATGSLRRRAQVRYLRKDVKIEDLRGNINTRIQKYLDSDWDAIILAKAGVERLGLEEYISGTLDINEMIPAVGQGALGIEIREDNIIVKELLSEINHTETEIEIIAERAFLSKLGGGCQTPIAAYAKLKGDRLIIDGLAATVDGKNYFRSAISGSKNNPVETGEKLAHSLLKMGANKIIQDINKNNRR